MTGIHDTQSTKQSFLLFKDNLLKIIKQNKVLIQEIYNLNAEVMYSLNLLFEINKKISENKLYEDLNELLRYPDYDNLISPTMQQKIAAYYQKYKNKTYSTKYKIDKKIHEILMNIGNYLEKIEPKIKAKNIKRSELEKRFYSFLSSINDDFRNYLVFLSKLIKKIAIKLAVLGAGMFYGTSFMSIYVPEMVDWAKTIFLFNRINDLLIIMSFVIDPNKKHKIKVIKYEIMDILGIHKDKLYSIYIKFIYKFYDLLNAIMSFIANLDTYLKGSNDWKEFYTKLEYHIAAVTGISLKRLIDVIDFDVVAIDEFLRNLNEYERLGIYNYSLRLSFGALNRLKEHYGHKVSTESGWVRFTLRYTGGRHYFPANPLDKELILQISGFDGDMSEKVDFITASILLADEIILDSAGGDSLSKGIIRIDLQELRWLVYKSRTWIARKLDKILLRDTRLLTPQTLGYELFEAFIKLNEVQSANIT